MSSKKAVVAKECVACGTCVRPCPIAAISIHRGVYAIVDEQKCVGCGKCACACPASVISIISLGSGEIEEKAFV